MSDEMTGVYSGGLMYEYSMEANNYGIVEIDGTSVEELDEYAAFKSALSKYPAPTGSGGAASTTHSAACPTSDSIWQVDPTKIPTLPSAAEKVCFSPYSTSERIPADGVTVHDCRRR